jgi:hypothetical protein
VHGADVEAGISERPLDRLVVSAGAFHGDDEVVEAVVGDGSAEPLDGGPEAVSGVGHLDGFDQDVAEEIGEHPLGPGLGAVDADDAEVLGSDLLDAGVQDACGLVDLVRSLPAASPSWDVNSHGVDLHAGADGSPGSSRGSLEAGLG